MMAQWVSGPSDPTMFLRCSQPLANQSRSVGLSGVNHAHKFANLGYWVRTKRTHQGVASAATRLIALFALEELRLNRLELLVPIDNKASQRVAEKAGARWEGVLRKRLILTDSPHDAVLYSLVAEEQFDSQEGRVEQSVPLELQAATNC